ncbi:MAG TPA: HAD family hydrolase [Candidatus Acidoferrum sp.]|nr:HAD family hydrolase [Candidatus Acidoferrum sp.]
MIKAVLFDFDGVIVNSFDAFAAYFQRILVKHGYRKPSEEEIRRVYYMPEVDILRTLSNEREDEKVYELFSDKETRPSEFSLADGAGGVIRRLSKRYRLAIISNSERRFILPILSKEGIDRCFEFVIANGETKRHKPDPEPILVALSRLGIRPEEAVYVGDYPSDIEAGKAAGTKVVYLSMERDGREDARITSLKELPAVLIGIDKG